MTAFDSDLPVPIAFLTSAMSARSCRDDDNKGDIQFVTMAHVADGTAFVLDNQNFQGSIKDDRAGAWESLSRWALESGLSYKWKNTRELRVQVVFIEQFQPSPQESIARIDFCERWANTFPINLVSPWRDESKNYRSYAYGKGRIGFEINQDHYLSISCDEAHFESVTNAINRFAADFYITKQVGLWKKHFLENGATQNQVDEKINRQWVLDEMALMNIVPIEALRQSAEAAKLKTALLQVTSPASDFINADFDYLTDHERAEVLNLTLDAMAILAPLAYNLRPIVKAAETEAPRSGE